MVNFTYNSITGKDSVSIFQALRRSNSELTLEIELEDNIKERITSEPTEETDAIVLIAQFIEQDPIILKTLTEALDTPYTKH